MTRLLSFSARLAELAASRPSSKAVTCGDQSLSYADLHRRSNRLARGLRALGVGQGDLVTIGLPNSVGFVEACWGIWKLGATPQPVSFRLPAGELANIVNLANPPLIIGDFTGLEKRPVVGLEEIEANSDGDSDLEKDLTAPILKAPTSGGSTGSPKLILSGKPAVVPEEPESEWGWEMSSETTALIPAPLYHNAGFGMMYTAINRGAHLVLTPRFDPELTLAEIERTRATWIYLVPTMMNRIWQLPSEIRNNYDLTCLKSLWHLAAPCPAWLKLEFINWLGPEVVMELYGGTEGQATAMISGIEWLSHRGSVGRAVSGQFCIIGDDSKPLESGQTGEVYMRRNAGDPPTYHYRGAEARTLPGGWESLGDMGWMDEEGYLYLADRRADIILVGGANVYPAEVEAALDRYKGVLSSAVIGLPDADLGEAVHAIVQALPGVSVDSLMTFLKDQLVSYKLPKSIKFVDTPLRDEAGKLRRSSLRDELLEKSA
ncbi:AMP-binding protein [Parasphingorhabdus sp.]|uniref:AMP-binding protein n=1 Tax=Parasphingorhabdus sp. TaxID=2709688 RepID=UPI0032ECC7A7